MSYASRFFQSQAAIAGNHGAPCPHVSPITSPRLHRLASATWIGEGRARQWPRIRTVAPTNIRIGGQYMPRRRNAASKLVTVTGFTRKNGVTMVCWTQGNKAGQESPAEFATRVAL